MLIKKFAQFQIGVKNIKRKSPNIERLSSMQNKPLLPNPAATVYAPSQMEVT